MARCYYSAISNNFNEKWESEDGIIWIVNKVEHGVVRMCRKAFGKRYRNMWIDVIWVDDKYLRYTTDFYSKVGVRLYHKISKVPKKTEDMDDFEYSALIYQIAHEDIEESIKRKEKPISVEVEGVRIRTDELDEDFDIIVKEIIKSVKVVKFV